MARGWFEQRVDEVPVSETKLYNGVILYTRTVNGVTFSWFHVPVRLQAEMDVRLANPQEQFADLNILSRQSDLMLEAKGFTNPSEIEAENARRLAFAQENLGNSHNYFFEEHRKRIMVHEGEGFLNRQAEIQYRQAEAHGYLPANLSRAPSVPKGEEDPTAPRYSDMIDYFSRHPQLNDMAIDERINFMIERGDLRLLSINNGVTVMAINPVLIDGKTDPDWQNWHTIPFSSHEEINRRAFKEASGMAADELTRRIKGITDENEGCFVAVETAKDYESMRQGGFKSLYDKLTGSFLLHTDVPISKPGKIIPYPSVARFTVIPSNQEFGAQPN